MDFDEGSTSIESLLGGDDNLAMTPQNTSTAEAQPGSMAVGKPTCGDKKKNDGDSKKSKTNNFSDKDMQRLSFYVLAAYVAISLPVVQEKLQEYISMLAQGGTPALVINGFFVAAIFYAILKFT